MKRRSDFENTDATRRTRTMPATRARETFVPFPNPNGIASISPGLRGTSYPGWTVIPGTTPTGLRHVGRAGRHNPFRVDEVCCTVSQGSSCLATLGWMTESRWDSRKDAPLFTQIATIGLKIQNLLRTRDLLLPRLLAAPTFENGDMSRTYTEDQLVEPAAIGLFAELRRNGGRA